MIHAVVCCFIALVTLLSMASVIVFFNISLVVHFYNFLIGFLYKVLNI